MRIILFVRNIFLYLFFFCCISYNEIVS